MEVGVGVFVNQLGFSTSQSVLATMSRLLLVLAKTRPRYSDFLT